MRKRSSPSGARSAGGSAVSRPRPTRSKTARGLRTWLPSKSSYAAAEGVTLAAIVTYDVMDATAGQTKLPRPGPIVATMGFYAFLAAIGSISRTFEPVVVAVGWVLALAVLVTGRRGAGILHLLQTLAGYAGKLGGDSSIYSAGVSSSSPASVAAFSAATTTGGRG